MTTEVWFVKLKNTGEIKLFSSKEDANRFLVADRWLNNKPNGDWCTPQKYIIKDLEL